MKYKLISFFVALFALIIQFSSCKQDNLEDLLIDPMDSLSTICDTSFIVSYQNDIVPILATRFSGVTDSCYHCHNVNSYQARGTVRLDAYEFLILKATEDNLLCRIKHKVTCAPMPQSGGKLSDCNIARIEAWINQGTPNN